jgi:2-(1,2-epoxy-1,2-dihydrophenyl)acetyl-CoA isomerase
MAYATILFSIAADVATITLNRPDRLNAITPEMLDELLDALGAAEAGGARAILLTGAGRAFSSGADLIAGGAMPDDLGETIERHYNPVAERLAGLKIPVVSAIGGPAVGAGLSLALAADIVVAARSAYLLLGFVNIGLVPDAGATWLVAKAAGRLKALELALLGERLSAEDALPAGLVTRVVADERLEEEASAIAARLATLPTVALGLIRQQVRTALTGTLNETLAVERANQRVAGRTADFREGVAAFAEKRAPRFTGR